jgi:hypothetical protein
MAIGLVANNGVPVADVVGLGHRIVAASVVPSGGLFAGQADCDCGPLQLVCQGPDAVRLSQLGLAALADEPVGQAVELLETVQVGMGHMAGLRVREDLFRGTGRGRRRRTGLR